MELRANQVTCLLLGILVAGSAGADTDVLYTKKGEEYTGRLSSVSADSVALEHEMDGMMAFALPGVQRVELGRPRPGDGWRTIEDIDDPALLLALDAAPSEEEYPNAGYVTIYHETAYRLNRDGSADITTRKIQKVLQERGKGAANNALYYLSANSTGRIDFGRTVTADGQVVPLSDAAIQDGSVFSAYPEYQNLHKKQSALKKVREGSVIDYQTTIHEEEVSSLTPFLVAGTLGDREPALKLVLSVTVPEEIECAYQMVRFDSDTPGSVEKLEDGLVRYVWTREHTDELAPENFMPSTSDLWPRVAFAPRHTWEGLSQEYAAVIADPRRPGEAIARKVAELIEGRRGREDRARAIYGFMVNEIRTIPASYHVYSLLPQDVNEVFERKYGNNLDKSVLFLTMLESAGVTASLCLVAPQSQGVLMEEVPSLGHFSECLVRVSVKGGPWHAVRRAVRRILGRQTPDSDYIITSVLDEKVQFGYLAPQYQHIRGLLIDGDDGQLISTPLLPGEREAMVNTADVEITEEGDFTVREQTRYAGEMAASLRGFKVLREEELTKRIQQMVAGIHPHAEMVSYQMSDLADLEVPVELTVTYRIRDYPLRAGEKLMVFHLPNLDYSAAEVGKPSRIHPLDWSSRAMTTNQYTLRLPEGFTANYVPEDVTYETPLMTYAAGFESRGGTIVFRDEYRRHLTDAPEEMYPVFKKGIETRAKLSREWVVLERE